MAIPYIGRRYTPADFEAYLASLDLTAPVNGRPNTFRPAFVTLHHTGVPSLFQRPTGYSDLHLRNTLAYYQSKGWNGAPHLFVDDRTDGIIVFQALNRRGTHAVSFNRNSWGVEMLGNYDVEPFHTGRGLAVQNMALQALASMCRKLGVTADTIKFHRDDPKTTKTCPGKNVTKAAIHSKVGALLSAPVPEDLNPEEDWKEWKLFLGTTEFIPVHEHEGRPIVPIRKFWTAAGMGGNLALSADKKSVIWTTPAGATHAIPVAVRDEGNITWALVRAFEPLIGKPLKVDGLNLSF